MSESVPTPDRVAMEPPTPLQNTPGVDEAIALAECVRSHASQKQVHDGVAFAISGGWSEQIDARRLLHAVRSRESTLAFHRAEEWSGAHVGSLCAFAYIPDEIVSYMTTYLCACDLFNLARVCKEHASSFWASLVSDGDGWLRQRVERAARIPDGLTACKLMCEMDSALCMLSYFSHSNVHKFKHGNERQPCLNAITSIHTSGGVRRSISVLSNNAVSFPGVGPTFQRSNASPSGAFVLYFPSHEHHIYLIEKQTHVQQTKYSVVAREEVEPGIDVGIQWTSNGPKAIVYHMRTKRSLVAFVVERKQR